MNRRPVSYKQTDTRWAKLPYRVKGEQATIGGSGCGPTCAAMLIQTLTGKRCTPVETCQWSMEHGYKALNQGTYHSYFVPQFEAYGISCRRVNTASAYGKPEAAAHDEMLELVKQGYYIIALMGKGLWTSSGHFVVVWWADGKVYINDPASSKVARQQGDMDTFRRQAKYYWAIDAREHNREEDEDMTEEQFDKHMERWLARQDAKATDAVWKAEGVARAKEAGITDGSRPMGIPTRAEVMIMAAAAAKK